MYRYLEILFSLLLLIVLLPVLAVIIIMIKATSRGPVLFKQVRVGRYKNLFEIFKFRTMYVEAPRDVPTHKLDDAEKHITPIGRFLRRTSLDELPQLINILKGDMSFVGPRPALYNQYDLIALREQYNIHSIRPGITGWAQINGRDELEIKEKVDYDKYYVDHKTMIFDLKIIFLTFFNVIQRKGIVEGKQNKFDDKNIPI